MSRKKEIRARYFSKMAPGSLRASIFSVMNFTLGTGILYIPFVFRMVGLLPAIFLLFLSGLICLFTIMCLVRSQKIIGAITYPELIAKSLGRKAGELLRAIIFFGVFGGIVSNNIIISTDAQQLLVMAFPQMEKLKNEWTRTLLVMMSFLIQLPLCVQKKATHLRYFSLIGVISAIFPVFLVCFFASYYLENSFFPRDYTLVKTNWSFFSAFSICLHSFGCHPFIMTICTELENPTEKRLFKVSLLLKVCYFSGLGVQKKRDT